MLFRIFTHLPWFEPPEQPPVQHVMAIARRVFTWGVVPGMGLTVGGILGRGALEGNSWGVAIMSVADIVAILILLAVVVEALIGRR